jgi:hypothetical protein
LLTRFSFDTLTDGQKAKAGQDGSAPRLSGAPSDRLVWALQVFFEKFGLGNLCEWAGRSCSVEP